MTGPHPQQSSKVLRPVSSLGVEYVKGEDPTKLHGVVLDSGESMWRAECMACGYLGGLQTTPGPARAAAVRHANGASHGVRLAHARRKNRETEPW